jgi:selenocysteine lyase/cysteine desulfurase
LLRQQDGAAIKPIYLDNSSTSFPQPPVVIGAMVRFANECGASPGRGAYAEAKVCEQIISTCRGRIARLIHAKGGKGVILLFVLCQACQGG